MTMKADTLIHMWQTVRASPDQIRMNRRSLVMWLACDNGGPWPCGRPATPVDGS